MATGYGLPPRPAHDDPRGHRYALTHDGRTQSLYAWAQESPVSYPALVRRLTTMSLAKALTTPRIQQDRVWWRRREAEEEA